MPAMLESSTVRLRRVSEKAQWLPVKGSAKPERLRPTHRHCAAGHKPRCGSFQNRVRLVSQTASGSYHDACFTPLAQGISFSISFEKPLSLPSASNAVIAK